MEWLLQDDRPIFQQLYEQLARRIVSGYYPLGGRLPSVRELAAEAGVNPNTMQRALSQLETNGLAESNRTSGRCVTNDAEKIAQIRRSFAAQSAKSYLESTKLLGYSTSEAISLLSQEDFFNE